MVDKRWGTFIRINAAQEITAQIPARLVQSANLRIQTRGDAFGIATMVRITSDKQRRSWETKLEPGNKLPDAFLARLCLEV